MPQMRLEPLNLKSSTLPLSKHAPCDFLSQNLVYVRFIASSFSYGLIAILNMTMMEKNDLRFMIFSSMIFNRNFQELKKTYHSCEPKP